LRLGVSERPKMTAFLSVFGSAPPICALKLTPPSTSPFVGHNQIRNDHRLTHSRTLGQASEEGVSGVSRPSSSVSSQYYYTAVPRTPRPKQQTACLRMLTVAATGIIGCIYYAGIALILLSTVTLHIHIIYCAAHMLRTKESCLCCNISCIVYLMLSCAS
jgi:hypothetical protein